MALRATTWGSCGVMRGIVHLALCDSKQRHATRLLLQDVKDVHLKYLETCGGSDPCTQSWNMVSCRLSPDRLARIMYRAQQLGRRVRALNRGLLTILKYTPTDSRILIVILFICQSSFSFSFMTPMPCALEGAWRTNGVVGTAEGVYPTGCARDSNG